VEVSQVVQEWLDQGRAEGVALFRAKLLRLLQVRLNQEPSTDLVALVQSQSDLATLGCWFDQALTAPSLDALRAAFTSG
jgi:hypothetical protein